MSIERIDQELCNGCGLCTESCPVDVIRMDDATGKAAIVYPDDCMVCLACERDCPEQAIHVSAYKLVPPLMAWG